MNFADIKICDAANGPGVRVSLFVSGCTHGCKGCFNKETWDFNYGTKFSEREVEYIIEKLAPDYISGLTILGGEPFHPNNQKDVFSLIQKVRKVYGDSKSIWVYTGYLLDKDILNGRIGDFSLYLPMIDVVVDGPFVEEEKDLRIKFRGSRNQRLIDIKETLRAIDAPLS